MLSKFFEPVEINGYKFDKGMQLYEFSAMREPEATRFPKIGEFIRSRAEMIEIDTPHMYWHKKYWPDMFISNRIDFLKIEWPLLYGSEDEYHPKHKKTWPENYPLHAASYNNNGSYIHEEIVEPMCMKISENYTSMFSAKYHRSLWLPIYWPETLTEGKSIYTKFYYPKAGYAGAPLHDLPPYKKEPQEQKDYDAAEITLTFVTGKPKHKFSVLFVVDPSPIYRITDQDECSQSGAETHRFTIESRGDCTADNISAFVDKDQILGSMKIKMSLPTIRNVGMGWKPSPNMNEMLWSVMNAP